MSFVCSLQEDYDILEDLAHDCVMQNNNSVQEVKHEDAILCSDNDADLDDEDEVH